MWQERGLPHAPVNEGRLGNHSLRHRRCHLLVRELLYGHSLRRPTWRAWGWTFPDCVSGCIAIVKEDAVLS